MMKKSLLYCFFILTSTVCLIQIVASVSNELVFVENGDEAESQFNKVDKIQISDEVFIPTSEWQTIKPDQGIPRGLHVRLNIQTGVKEAKLLDEKDKTSKTNPTDIKAEKIKKSIEKLNDEKFEKNNIDTKSDPENLFRSYQEFKDDLKAANINLYSDSEIIQELVKNFNITEDKKQALEILDDIEYYVHKIDNSLVLCDIGGFNLLMIKLNTSQDIDLKTKYALVLGSSMQGNPYVKIHALESNILPLLLNQIATTNESDNFNNQNFISRLLFSLSGLLGNFPLAQNRLIQYGGIETLTSILKNPTYSVKLKAKALTLVNDMISERNEANKSDDQKKNEQYLEFDLSSKLTEWCGHLEPMLQAATDNDTYEKLFDATISIIDKCEIDSKDSFKAVLNKLKQNYLEISKEDNETEEDNYFLELTHKIDKILTFL